MFKLKDINLKRSKKVRVSEKQSNSDPPEAFLVKKKIKTIYL
jgi:hypothetical protein